MRISTWIVLGGAGMFVLPIPGTFILGTLTMVSGGIVRLLGA